MIKALKMDLYRYRKTPSLYILLGASIITCAFTMFSMYLMSSPLISESGAMPEELLTIIPKTVDGYINTFFQGNFIVMFTAIFAIIFNNSEHRGGYIKNIASVTANRLGLILSRIVILLLTVILLHALSAACVFISCFTFLDTHEIINPSGIIMTIVTSVIMNLSFGTFCMMIFMLCRNAVLPLVSNIVYIFLGSTVFTLVDLIFTKLIGVKNFAIEKYTNLGNMIAYVNTEASSKTYTRAIIVAVVIMTVCAVVSWQSLDRKDIK